MSVGERMEPLAYIERTIESESVAISEVKKAVVRSRAAELERIPRSVWSGTHWTHGWLRAGAGRDVSAS
jgi:hypothetical protein